MWFHTHTYLLMKHRSVFPIGGRVLRGGGREGEKREGKRIVGTPSIVLRPTASKMEKKGQQGEGEGGGEKKGCRKVATSLLNVKN